MIRSFGIPTLAAAAAGVLTLSAPAAAAPSLDTSLSSAMWNGSGESWQHSRDRRGYYNDDYRSDRYRSRRNYDEPVYRDTRVWRGQDGRAYCRKRDGTTGLIIGAAGGALIGRAIDTRGDRALGTILGAAGGAILGREIDRDRYRCR